MPADVLRIDSRLLALCVGCGRLFRHHTQRLRRCEVCRATKGDLPADEIERRYRAARQANAGRFALSTVDVWRGSSSLARVMDRGPETEVGVNFPEAW